MINIIIQILLGFILADIVGGIFHWFEDTYLSYCINIPFLNKIAVKNEMHHYFPRSIVAKSYLENISTTVLILLIFLPLIYLFYRINRNYIYFIISFLFFISISNVIHRFSHMRDCEKNNFIILLQKSGILCSSEHHKIHHEGSNQKYCVISEYNNYILDNIYFWRILEYVIYQLTSIKPDRKPGYDDYYKIHNYMHENAKLPCPKKPSKEDLELLKYKLKNYMNCSNHNL